MPIDVSPNLLYLISDAALKSFWRKQTLRSFLRRCGVSESFLSTWSAEESKREFLDRLFPKIERAEKGSFVVSRMARTLAEQTNFPDLEGWEDSDQKKKQAREAVRGLKDYLTKEDNKAASEREREESRKRLRSIQEKSTRQRITLEKLDDGLKSLVSTIGSQATGYSFQDWFYDLLDYFEADSRRPYVVDGRQIDGSVTIDGTTYLVELKFTTEQIGAPDVDVFYKKVQDKADNTMGIMVSMSGYSSVAMEGASGPKTPLLLMDHSHLYLMLTGAMTFAELINRVRRHASQTGKAYLAVKDFGG